MEMLMKNWTHVGPILTAAFFAIAVGGERFVALFVRSSFGSFENFFGQIKSMVHSGRMGDALALCDKYSSKPAARVVKEGLLRAGQPEEVIQHGLEIAVGDEIVQVQKRVNYLATIANVATLLGLFGTILGMIHSFEAIGSASAQQRSSLLAAGISTAMNATLMGLGVAIPCMVLYSLFAAKTNRIVAQIEGSATRTIDLIEQKYYATQSHSAPAAPQGFPRRAA